MTSVALAVNFSDANPQQIAETFGTLFNYLDRLEEFENTVIELLPYGTDEEVEQTRIRARALGKAGWRIECACDAVLLSREPLKGGRGRIDIEGVGRIAAARDEGKKKGKVASTVRRNAQIFNTFKTVLNDQHSLLDDKGFFEAALRAPNAKKAIKMFEKERSENPNFSVGDAFKLAKNLKESQTKVEIPDVPNYLDPHFKSFLLDVENTLLSFKNRCPRPEFEIRLDQWIRSTRFERARTPQSDYEAVKKQIDEGACTVEEIAEEVYLSASEINGLCIQIVGCKRPTKDEDLREAGTPYEWRPIGVNTDVAKGSRTYGTFRKDAPSGDSFRPSAVEHEDWD
jgi:hypothetical protein